AAGDRLARAAASESAEEGRRPGDLQRRPGADAGTPQHKGEQEQDQRQPQQPAADDAERLEKADPGREPGVKRDEADHQRADRGQRGQAVERADQAGIADLAPDFAPRPADLPIDVGTDRAQQRSEHQPRPRVIIPMITPTSSVPAIVASGFCRAMPSSSEANVLARSSAADARSDPVSATLPAVVPTCDATVWLMLRKAFAASPPACEAS